MDDMEENQKSKIKNQAENTNGEIDVKKVEAKADKVKMTIDQDICIRCGSCHITYPDVFEGRADGTSHPIEGVTVDRVRAQELKLICPVEAIDLKEIDAV